VSPARNSDKSKTSSIGVPDDMTPNTNLVDYTFYSKIAGFGEPENSTKAGECINNISVADARIHCNTISSGCEGFYSYNSVGKGRTCFVTDVDSSLPKRYISTETSKTYPNAGFYLLSSKGQKTEGDSCLSASGSIDDLCTDFSSDRNSCTVNPDVNGSPGPRLNSTGQTCEFSEGEEKNYKFWKGVGYFGSNDPSHQSRIGCLENVSLNESKTLCNEENDCEGFFSYDPTKPSRVCFKTNIDINSEPHYSTDGTEVGTANANPNSGFYAIIDQSDTSETETVDYTFYKDVVRMGLDGASSIGDKNGCSNNISISDAKQRCTLASDCDGIFAYDSIHSSRVCFKKNIYTNDDRTYALTDFLKNNPNTGYFVGTDQSDIKLEERTYKLNKNKSSNGGVSTKWTKDDTNGCFNNINVKDAKIRCDAQEDCNAFFTYNYKGQGRVCFINSFTDMKDVSSSPSLFPHPALYVVEDNDDE